MTKKPFLFRISTGDKIFFARNLALLLKSGISLAEALETLKNSANSLSLKFILDQVIKDIERGQFLADSLLNFEDKFDKFFIATIKVGETSGKLIENLEKISSELQKIAKLKNKVITTLIYPTFIILVMILVMILVVYFLFPKILPIFESLNIELPFITKIFISGAKFILNYGYYFFGFIILMILILTFSLRYEKPKFYFHKTLLNLPLLSRLFINYSLTEFSRNLAILLESGLTEVEALRLSGESSTNYVYRQKILIISNLFAKGHKLSELLEKDKKFFPYQFTKMISIGEKTGTLSNTLIYLAQNYEEEIDINLERFVNSLEPIILIIVAGIVAFMALAIILPIYELSDKLSK